MKITEVALENFKSHESRVFTFGVGSNAISGPNGSGKTSILEAISWALFDYLPYKPLETVVKNTKNTKNASAKTKVAKVMVSFISDLDGHEYEVSRSTKRQYYIIDKKTNERIAENKQDVLPFLKKHYNLADTANLEEIFTNTIGVPQGTITSIFLETPTKRRDVFDKALNLDEYRKAFENIKDFKAYLATLTSESSIKIASLEAETKRIPEITESILQTEKEIAAIELKNKEYTASISDLSLQIKTLDEIEKKINQLSQELDKEKTVLTHSQKDYEQTKTYCDEAKKATEDIKILKPFYDNYLRLKESLNSLEEKKDKIEKLNKQLYNDEKNIQNIQNHIKNTQEKIKSLETTKDKIKELDPLAKKAESLEKDKNELEKSNDSLKVTKAALLQTQNELTENRKKLENISRELEKAEDSKSKALLYEALEKQYTDFKREFDSNNRLLEESKSMLSEVKGGLCPFLQEKCLNMNDGQDLESYFKNKINEIDKSLQQNLYQIKQTTPKLEDAKNALQILQKLETKEFEKEQILKRIELLQEKADKANDVINEFKEIPNKIAEINALLKDLGSPQAQINLLMQSLKEEESLKKTLSLALKNEEKEKNKIETITKEIEELKFNEDEYFSIKKELKENEEKYLTYLKLLPVSEKLAFYETKTQDLVSKIKSLEENLESLEKKLQETKQSYEKERHQSLKQMVESQQLEQAKLEQSLKHYKTAFSSLTKELDKLQKLKLDIEKEQMNIAKVLKMEQFVATARDIFKQSPKHVGQYYIENISIEANQIYKDITQNDMHELRWTPDYEIMIEEDGVTRTFNNLSGGEQMAAALSVRLALLKELSDINIAFFDEPTTNMDEQRRANLAQQIKNITSFDQLFVISHDDTFEQDIDNVIRV